jgi:ferredoxin
MQTTIYYFSGTGNSLKVAKDLQILLPDCRLESIAELMQHDRLSADGEMVGVIFPVYWLGLPVLVKRFLENLEIAPQTYVFAVNTFGGLNGQSIYQIQKLLQQKGVPLQAGFSIWMPGNGQTYYPPFPNFLQQMQFKRQENKTRKIAEFLSARKQMTIRPNLHIPKFLFRLYYDGFLRNVAATDQDFWTDTGCTRCGLCARICPVCNITCTDQAITWHGHCEACLACMQWCPSQAIQYKNRLWKKQRYHHPEIKVNELLNKN